MKEREVIKKMLEALEVANSCVDGYYIPKGKTQLPEVEEAIAAANEILAPPDQEPVAWGMPSAGGGFIVDCITPEEHDRVEGGYTVPLYTTPPQRTWVGLTPEEVDSLANLKVDGAYLSVPDTIRQTDAKLKEKNT